MIQHPLQIGSILYSSWGYEQTNVDFYEVINLIGKCTVELRELVQTKIHHNGFSGKTKPIKGAFIGDPLRRRVNVRGYVKINECQNARTWDGMEMYFSSYA